MRENGSVERARAGNNPTMTHSPKILAFAGSLRRDSFNKKLVKLGADAARAAGAEVTLIDLADYPMPVYDGDIEAREGLPGASPAGSGEGARQHHQGRRFISSPEYNSSISAARSRTRSTGPLAPIPRSPASRDWWPSGARWPD